MLTRGRKRATLRAYRKRVKASTCRRRLRGSCRRTPGCKLASGSRRRFCRKTKNTKLRRNTNKTRKHNK